MQRHNDASQIRRACFWFEIYLSAVSCKCFVVERDMVSENETKLHKVPLSYILLVQQNFSNTVIEISLKLINDFYAFMRKICEL